MRRLHKLFKICLFAAIVTSITTGSSTGSGTKTPVITPMVYCYGCCW